MAKGLDLKKRERKDLIRLVDLKLARADSQARILTDRISAWICTFPIATRCELREGSLGFRVIQEKWSEAPPLDEWGLQMGECVHNLRSALDNLAFALARLRCDPPKEPWAINFPIFQDKEKFDKKGLKKLNQIPAEAAPLIELFQPFQRNRSDVEGTPETDALVLLQRLSNDDKHRVPSPVLIAPKEIANAWAVEIHSHEDAKANVPPDTTIWKGPLQPGAVLLEYRTNRPIVSWTQNSFWKPVAVIKAAKKLEPVDTTMRELSRYVSLVVAHFRHFFK